MVAPYEAAGAREHFGEAVQYAWPAVPPAMAAKEALTRDLSAELAPQGVRVVGLRPQAMPETRTIKEAFEPRAKASGMTWEQWLEALAGAGPTHDGSHD